MDGDLCSHVLPSNDIKEILDDPFGVNTIINNNPHLNPNRSTAHWFFKEYFHKIPLLFQKIVSPIESLYYSSALAKITTHILLLYFLSFFILKARPKFNFELVIISLLLTPFFQAFGYHNYLGIIDTSITYTFFYAIPLMFLLFFYSFIYRTIISKQKAKLTFFSKTIVTLLVISLPFSGAIIPPVILIVSGLIAIYYYRVNETHPYNLSFKSIKNTLNNIPTNIKVILISISVLSLYSLFLGTYNAGYQSGNISIIDRYARLPTGIYYQFTQKLAFPALFLYIAINLVIIKKYYYTEKGRKIISSSKWILIFSLIYLILMPLGGFREYRENILRYDSIMPITIGLIYLYGASSFYLLKSIKRKKTQYAVFLIAFFLIFTNADRSELNNSNNEKLALKEIQNSEKEIVVLKNNCSVLAWGTLYTPNESSTNADMMVKWNITSKRTLYYFDSTKTSITPHKPF